MKLRGSMYRDESAQTLKALTAKLQDLDERVTSIETGTGTSTETGTPDALYSFDFTNTFSYPTLTFEDGTEATAIGTSTTVTWSALDGITTKAGGALQLPDVNFGGAFSIEVYFRFNVVAPYNRICAFYHSHQNESIAICRLGTEQKIRFYVETAGALTACDTQTIVLPTTTDWHHLVATRSVNGNLSVYVNNLLVGSSSNTTTNATAAIMTRANNYIGRDSYGDTGDETTKFLRIYATELGASDVTTLFHNL